MDRPGSLSVDHAQRFALHLPGPVPSPHPRVPGQFRDYSRHHRLDEACLQETGEKEPAFTETTKLAVGNYGGTWNIPMARSAPAVLGGRMVGFRAASIPVQAFLQSPLANCQGDYTERRSWTCIRRQRLLDLRELFRV